MNDHSIRPRLTSSREPMVISPMLPQDVQDALRVERFAFSSYWPQGALAGELQNNQLAHYFVGRINAELIAYGGIWVMLEDAHVTTIAVHPDRRGHSYGEELFAHLLDETIARDAAWMSLEVRKSNVVAQRLYAKYGFAVVSQRPNYYNDNHETALVMWAGNLRGDLYRNHVRHLRTQLQARKERAS